MECGAAVTVCPVRGCEETFRRADMKDHNARRQMRHFSLVSKDRQNLLWNALEGVGRLTQDIFANEMIFLSRADNVVINKNAIKS